MGSPPRLCRIAAIAMLGCARLLASAQDAPPADDQRVIVTGSQIPRIDGETALPLQIITREEIDRSGVQGIDELMQLISANFGGQNVALGVGDSVRAGFSGASLRGLGDRYTLVLLDGRRVANHAFSDESGGGVDLNTIPLAAIERVEVLRDGASAIYGSDAIGGVINFVLKNDFAGADGSVTHGWTQDGGGGATRRETLAAGHGVLARDGYNLLAVIDHRREQALLARKRSFADSSFEPSIDLFGLSRSSFPANVLLPDGSLVSPAAPACSPSTVSLGGACWFDPDSQNELYPATDNLGLLARATVALAGGDRVRAEVLWSRSRQRYEAAPSPINGGGLAGQPEIIIPVSSPYYPQGLGLGSDVVNLFYRTLQLGPRIAQSQTTQQRLLLGWQGRVADWSVDAALLQAITRSTLDLVSGNVDSDRIVAALATGLVNPFGDSGPEGDALVSAAQASGRARESTGRMRSVDVHASRDLAQWSDGPVTLGLGGELRNERLADDVTAVGTRVAGVGNRPLSKSGVRDMQAAWAELALPLRPRLDAQLALRVENYGDVGTGFNPKAALRWRPESWLLLRASGGMGMRAPTLPELYSPAYTFESQELPDPIRCPVTHLDSDCHLGVSVTAGGNPALHPERSKQVSFGIVLEPVRDTTLAVDWWHLRLRNVIDQLSDDIVLNGDPGFEGRNIVRGPADPALPTLPGPIVGLDETNENLNGRTISGIDVDLNARTPALPLGRFSIGLDASWLADWTTLAPDAAPIRAVGQYGYPRWRHTLTLGWDRGPWRLTLLQTAISSTVDLDGVRHVAPYDVWNAQLAWAPASAWDLAFGAKNLANKAPPATDAKINGFEPGNADPRGRTWYARVEAHWH